MPSSHPVQLWFGQFIHAVLEECYRQIKDGRRKLPPWPQPELDEIMDRIKCEPARKHLDEIVWERLEQNVAVAVK